MQALSAFIGREDETTGLLDGKKPFTGDEEQGISTQC